MTAMLMHLQVHQDNYVNLKLAILRYLPVLRA
jgi:SPX domain protein involved in polyphosphate accumulation